MNYFLTSAALVLALFTSACGGSGGGKAKEVGGVYNITNMELEEDTQASPPISKLYMYLKSVTEIYLLNINITGHVELRTFKYKSGDVFAGGYAEIQRNCMPVDFADFEGWTAENKEELNENKLSGEEAQSIIKKIESLVQTNCQGGLSSGSLPNSDDESEDLED